MNPVQNRLLKRSEVEIRTALSRSTIYAKLNSGDRGFDSSFPRPVSTGSSSVRWVEAEVNQWIQSRITVSRQNVNAGGFAQ